MKQKLLKQKAGQSFKAQYKKSAYLAQKITKTKLSLSTIYHWV